MSPMLSAMARMKARIWRPTPRRAPKDTRRGRVHHRGADSCPLKPLASPGDSLSMALRAIISRLELQDEGHRSHDRQRTVHCR